MKVLIIEDEPFDVLLLERPLEHEGYEVTSANSAERGLEAASRGDYNVGVTDSRTRPVEVWQDDSAEGGLIGRSRPMHEVHTHIGRVAAMPVSVLIRGETGTRKKLVAEFIHRHSNRSDQPFIQIDCRAGSLDMLELGLEEPGPIEVETPRNRHLRRAIHGTIAFYGVGDLSPSDQARLLRFLCARASERMVSNDPRQMGMRIIATSHCDLELAVEEKRFREDLYYRLNDFVITLPPLRQRVEDIRELAWFFVEHYSATLGLPPYMSIADDAVKFLEERRWPGNVHELGSVLREALSLPRGDRITREIVEQAVSKAPWSAAARNEPPLWD